MFPVASFQLSRVGSLRRPPYTLFYQVTRDAFSTLKPDIGLLTAIDTRGFIVTCEGGSVYEDYYYGDYSDDSGGRTGNTWAERWKVVDFCVWTACRGVEGVIHCCTINTFV